MQVFYGANTWMTHLEEVDFIANGVEGTVDVEYIENSGHHVFADEYAKFNEALNNCQLRHENKSKEI